MTDRFLRIAASQGALPRRALFAAGIAGVALLGGCSSHAEHPDKVARQVHSAIDKGQAARAVALAEAAVRFDGRNASLRLLLANAYLRAGRFESARTAYADAIGLGDDSSRAAIGLVLADLALGHNSAALDTINTYGDVMPAADLGLALAMAGQSERGIGVLTTAIRGGQNVPKVRQNLAYAYALAGMWSEARIMAGQDIPANLVDARVQAWASMARPEDARRRVAGLLGAPVVADSGQPEALALANFPANAADKTSPAAAPAQAAGETPVPQSLAQAPAAEAPSAQTPLASGALARIDLTAPAPLAAPAAPAPQPVFVQHPVVQPIYAAHPAANRVAMQHSAKPAAAAAPATAQGLGTHLVQLGAFNSEDAAHRAWQHFVARNPGLQSHRSLITKVTVRGRDFWRVQAAGFAGQASAASLCGSLRAHGSTCLVMAVNAAAHVNGVETSDARSANPAAHPAAPAHAPAPVSPAAAHPTPAHPGKVNATRR